MGNVYSFLRLSFSVSQLLEFRVIPLTSSLERKLFWDETQCMKKNLLTSVCSNVVLLPHDLSFLLWNCPDVNGSDENYRHRNLANSKNPDGAADSLIWIWNVCPLVFGIWILNMSYLGRNLCLKVCWKICRRFIYG